MEILSLGHRIDLAKARSIRRPRANIFPYGPRKPVNIGSLLPIGPYCPVITHSDWLTPGPYFPILPGDFQFLDVLKTQSKKANSLTQQYKHFYLLTVKLFEFNLKSSKENSKSCKPQANEKDLKRLLL